MIGRKNRFHGYGSLRFVYRNGETVRGPVISTKYAHNDRRSHYRLAVVVSKKVDKSAVGRNRMRRRLYEIVRELEQDIHAPYDMVITVFHDQLQQLSHEELKRMVRAQLRQAGIISDQNRDKINLS